MISKLSIVAGLTLLYIILVRVLRYQRRGHIASKYGMHKRSDFAALSADQSQAVLQELVEMEFPKLMGISIVFALFKIYGIPSVSSLLVTTGELSEPETASQRTADTGVLILEFCLNKPSSERALLAVARMNYLHSRYIKAGKISNDDLLYTLSLFALEPSRWIEKYEWRSFSDFERCAQGAFWKAMGDKMSIDFSALTSSRSGWSDGLHWLEEMQQWSEEYERENMIPAETNNKLTEAQLDVVFTNLPKGLRIMGKYLVATIVGERVRKAMILPRPPWLFVSAVEGLFQLRQMFLRHLSLPRPDFMRKKYVAAEQESNGRYSALVYLSHPWYVKPTFQRRWGAGAWVTRLLGGNLPGDAGSKYRPDGYDIAEVGPTALKDKGETEMSKHLGKMQMGNPGGCPFRLRT